jgi:hypothetical protein
MHVPPCGRTVPNREGGVRVASTASTSMVVPSWSLRTKLMKTVQMQVRCPGPSPRQVLAVGPTWRRLLSDVVDADDSVLNSPSE